MPKRYESLRKKKWQERIHSKIVRQEINISSHEGKQNQLGIRFKNNDTSMQVHISCTKKIVVTKLLSNVIKLSLHLITAAIEQRQ